MFRLASPALLLFIGLVLAGCAGNATDDGTGTTEGAATISPSAAVDAPRPLAGNYDGHMRGWDGSLAITNASAEKLDFEFEISPDLDVAPIGRLGGTATLAHGNYHYGDGSCTIDFERVTAEPGAKRGDLFVNASISCAIMLGIDDHTTSSTALDFTATWHRL